jgi:hypothetical protein
MIFGLLFGTVLTLILVPVMYLLMTKLKQRISRKKTTAVQTRDDEAGSVVPA